MVRLSPQVYRLLGVVAFALFLGIAFARAEVVLVAFPPLFAIFVGLAIDRSPHYDITHQVSAQRLFEGDLLHVTITIAAHSSVPFMEVLDPLPPSVQLASESHHKAFSLRAGQTLQWTYALRCLRRSQFILGNVHVRLYGRAGLLIREAKHFAPKPCAVYPQTVPLRRAIRPPHTQVYVGNYVSSALGEGMEFGNIRPFAPGDRTRRINWRTSLRLHDLYINEYQQERNADVVLMLDTLTSVGSPAVNTLDLCVRAAASLAWSYVRRKDRVGLIAYGGAFRWLKPGVGRAHFQAILDHLLEADVIFSFVAKDLALVPKRILPPRALIVALSPLVDERFVKALQDLPARAFPVILVTISPIAVTRRVLRPTLLTDIASRIWAMERAAQLENLRRQGIVVLEWHPQEPLEAVLAAATPRRRVRRVAR